MKNPLRLGILISGGGTTFLNLHEKIHEGVLNAEIVCVVSSSRKAKGLERAADLGYAHRSLNRRKFDDDQAFSDAINAYLLEHDVDLVVLAGFLKRYLPGSRFSNRCINIHPSLIPAFCGHGFYGMKVHEAVWKRGCRVSGCTVHFVNDNYDEGPIILQKSVALDDDDEPEDIRRKVFEMECRAMPEAVGLIADEKITIEAGRVRFR